MNRYDIYWLIAIVFSSITSFSQDSSNAFSFQVKLSSELSESGFVRSEPQYDNGSILSNFQPAISFYKGKRGLHEIELSDFSLANRGIFTDNVSSDTSFTSYSNYRDFLLRIRYEYQHFLVRGKRFQFLAGAAVSPYYMTWSDKPIVQLGPPHKNGSILGIMGQLIPHVQYLLSERLFLDLNFPITLAIGETHWKTTSWSGVQNKSSFSWSNFGWYTTSIRLGIGMKF